MSLPKAPAGQSLADGQERSNVTAIEAETQKIIHEQLQGQVPIPEVFGWIEDGDQTFIYMSLIEVGTLEKRWSGMDENERLAVCDELKQIVKAWRSLPQGEQNSYIGIGISLGHFKVQMPFRQFQDACGIEIYSDVPIVFTHNDLVPPNIFLSPGLNSKVAAIIDFGQAGWYPAYWEYCMARRVRIDPQHFDDATQEEWWTKYLPMILEPVDDEGFYHSWLWFVLSRGIYI
ncbi:phosphotransferase family protein [Penicillium mononematosum]|uniref:phosphotransferase family protein n=1 Tax=Penicillium mononematosum TaxID=268346 RepID=UPI002548DC7B|nr:phosphotransferase family protein [Penicillium mononematosum]KAJ6180469.1 phosphotransferase family protein [Penicillium mononematosum]